MAKFYLTMSFRATKYMEVDAKSEDAAIVQAVNDLYAADWNTLDSPDIECMDCYQERGSYEQA